MPSLFICRSEEKLALLEKGACYTKEGAKRSSGFRPVPVTFELIHADFLRGAPKGGHRNPEGSIVIAVHGAWSTPDLIATAFF
jgi:hypothetical protein